MTTVCVVDIDTTLANNDHRAALLERDSNGNIPQASWDAFLQPELMLKDTPQEHALDVLNHMRGRGFKIVFLTGRNIRHSAGTRVWLKEHMDWNEFTEPLLMRRAVDVNVPASECKEALFLDYLKTSGLTSNTTFLFFEDDPHVMAMWRRYGLVFQCPEAWRWMNPEFPKFPEQAWNR
jgi:hypothetical protein